MSAIISDCGKYRYRLDRVIDESNPRVCVFIMLNPSIADAETDDPTIRRCIDFTKRFNCGHLVVVNLFAYRATKPSDLKKTWYPVGPDNLDHVQSAIREAKDTHGLVICAWGAYAQDVESAAVRRILKEEDVVPYHLGLTASGQPRHPLYLPKTQQPIPWRL